MAINIGDIMKKMENFENKYNAETKFPVYALPKLLQEIVAETTERLHYSEDFIGSALLHAAGTAIGNTVNLDYKWKEAPNFYMAFIAGPGTGKTHPITWAYAPIRKKDELELEQAMELGYAEFNQTILSDTTIEAMTQALSNNKRGICILADELAGLLSAGGRNKELYLSLWSRQTVPINRKTSKTLSIKNPFVSMIGTMQTNILKQVVTKGNKTENGFLDRMLLVMPEKISPVKWGKGDKLGTAEMKWEEIINLLFKVKPETNTKGDFIPFSLTFSPEAEDLAIEYQNNPIDCTAVLSEDIVARINAKIEINFLRLCIVIRLLKAATGDNSKLYEIDTETVKSAIQIANYYKRTAFKVWQDLSMNNPLDRLSELKINITSVRLINV